MSLHRRRQLVQLARQNDALIIADDVYDFLLWDMGDKGSRPTETALLPRLVDIDRQMSVASDPEGFGHAISNGTFSKVVAPGCRTGWVEASERFIVGLSKLGSTISGGSPSSQLSAAFISSMLHSGNLQKHILEVLQPAFKSRHRTVVRAVGEILGPFGVGITPNDFDGIYGGYFVWLSLPSTLKAEQLSQEAREKQNLILAPGTRFNVSGDEKVVDLSRNIRLCFSWEDEAVLVEGIRRLGMVIEALLP